MIARYVRRDGLTGSGNRAYGPGSPTYISPMSICITLMQIHIGPVQIRIGLMSICMTLLRIHIGLVQTCSGVMSIYMTLPRIRIGRLQIDMTLMSIDTRPMSIGVTPLQNGFQASVELRPSLRGVTCARVPVAWRAHSAGGVRPSHSHRRYRCSSPEPRPRSSSSPCW